MKTRLWWLVHNVIGHPLMGAFQFVGLTVIGQYIHDVTLPPGVQHDGAKETEQSVQANSDSRG